MSGQVASGPRGRVVDASRPDHPASWATWATALTVDPTKSQRRCAVMLELGQLQLVPEVECVPVLERRGARFVGSPRRTGTSSTACQWIALLTWPRTSTSVERSATSDAVRRAAGRVAPSSSRRPARQRTPRRRRSSRACRSPLAREVDPDAVGLDSPAAISRERRPPPGGGGADSTPPRRARPRRRRGTGRRRRSRRQTTEMLRSAPARFRHVVRGDILEIPGDCVQPKAPGRARSEPEPSRHRERPAGRGPRRHQLAEVDRVFQPGHASIITAGAHAVDVPSFEGSLYPGEGARERRVAPTVVSAGWRPAASGGTSMRPPVDTGRR